MPPWCLKLTRLLFMRRMALRLLTESGGPRSLMTDGDCDGRYPWIRLWWPAHSFSRSVNFWIFPVDVLGSSVTKAT